MVVRSTRHRNSYLFCPVSVYVKSKMALSDIDWFCHLDMQSDQRSEGR